MLKFPHIYIPTESQQLLKFQLKQKLSVELAIMPASFGEKFEQKEHFYSVI